MEEQEPSTPKPTLASLDIRVSELEKTSLAKDLFDYVCKSKANEEFNQRLWRLIRRYLPWATSTIGLVVSALYWVAHNVTIR